MTNEGAVRHGVLFFETECGGEVTASGDRA